MSNQALNILTLSMLVIGATTPLHAQQPAKETGGLKDPNTLVFYRAEKIKAEGLVARLLAKYKATDPEAAEGRKLYDEAFRWYNAYIDQSLFNMVQGVKGDMTPSAEKAAKAAKDLETFVDAKTTTKSITAALAVAEDLVKFAVKLVDFFQDRAKKKRDEFAKALKPEVRWRSWAELQKEITQ